ncbi:hypothetical protein ACUY3P_06025 [Corynebacterium lehmanniae]
MVEHINEQGDPDFNVGGVKRDMPPELQLEQLASYMHATYEDGPNYLALLPDRITHAAMLMLGTAVDHALPATKWAGGVQVEPHALGVVFRPSEPNGRWAVSLWDGPANAKEMLWRPDVAAAAELSGTTILDVDSVADAAKAVELVGAEVVWALGDVALPPAPRYIVTFPTTQPSVDGLIQVRAGSGLEGTEYYADGFISTPAEIRRRVADAAEAL